MVKFYTTASFGAKINCVAKKHFFWSDGVLEQWSTGNTNGCAKHQIYFTILQYSTTPLLHFVLLHISPIHQPFIGMLGVLALLYHLQIALVFIGRWLDLIHAFLAIAFKEDGVRISGQQQFIGVKLFIGTLEIL